VKDHASKKRARERERERDVRLPAVGDDARSCMRHREKILC
jgi:hypothetical protein